MTPGNRFVMPRISSIGAAGAPLDGETPAAVVPSC
jgi:hypothetical protein